MLNYTQNQTIDPKQISSLRNSVGWNGMEKSYRNPLITSYYHICVNDNDKLVGFLDVVSNGVTDAYIQDVIVHPNYQGQGIGTQLMNMAINKLKQDEIYAISVLFDEDLMPFYKKFGFYIMMAGQIFTREED